MCPKIFSDPRTKNSTHFNVYDAESYFDEIGSGGLVTNDDAEEHGGGDLQHTHPNASESCDQVYLLITHLLILICGIEISN